MADAASCAIADQTTPNGFYNIEQTEISTMAELTNWVVDSDKVMTF